MHAVTAPDGSRRSRSARGVTGVGGAQRGVAGLPGDAPGAADRRPDDPGERPWGRDAGRGDHLTFAERVWPGLDLLGRTSSIGPDGASVGYQVVGLVAVLVNLGVALLVLLAVATLARGVPACRITKVDPMTTLRAE